MIDLNYTNRCFPSLIASNAAFQKHILAIVIYITWRTSKKLTIEI